jgi:hypothetical protein
MSRLRAYRYSAGSIVLAVVNLFVVFGLTSGLFTGSPPPQGSGPYRHLVLFELMAGLTSVVLAAIGLTKEQRKGVAIFAAVVSVWGFLLCGFRLAG